MPSLNRIILINTHMHGIVELNLQGHTNICGTNASGKTTLQRLIPVFYGEYPSRVVPATRDNFEKWYLPSEASFIIYEFSRGNDDEETCQAVLTSSGKGVDYRLIAKSFDLDDYSKSTMGQERHILTPIELTREIKRQGYVCTRKLNTKEFRAIIQNDRSILSGARDLPGFARLFSLCEQSQNLRHIEKLAKAVHSKEGKMETIKAMVAAILEEDGVQPGGTKLSHNKVEEWIREVKLVKGFDDIRPEFSKLEQAYFEFGDLSQRLAQLKQQYALDTSKLAQSIVENEAQLEEVVLNLRLLEAKWNESRDALNQSWSAAKGDVENYEKNLDQVELEFDQWQDKNIDELRSNVELLPRWNNELDNAEARLSLLTEKHLDIESSYNKRLLDIRDGHDAEMETYTELKDDLREQLADKKAQQQTQLLSTQQKFAAQQTSIKSDYQQQEHELRNQLVELNTLSSNQGFTSQEQEQLDILELTIKEAVSAEDSSRDLVRQKNLELDSVRRKRRDVDERLEQLRKKQRLQSERAEAVKKLLYPGQHTLLEFLRREKDGWEQALGKVINAELLSRSDLHPQLLENGADGLFGVKLDLSKLDTPDYANSEHELKLRLERETDALSAILTEQDEVEALLTESSREVRDTELQLAKLQTELNNAELTRKRSQQDKDDTQREFNQSKQERRQSYQAKAAGVKDQIQRLQALRQEAIDELTDQQQEAEMELRTHWQVLVDEITQQQLQLDTQISQCKSSFQVENKSIEAWLQDELANRGVDVDEIGALKRQIKQLKTDIQAVEKKRHLVLEYKVWYETYYLGHKVSWQEQLVEAKKMESHARRELDKQLQSFKQDSDVAKTKQQHYEVSLKKANQLQHELAAVSKQIKGMKLPVAEVVQESAKVGQRINEGQSLLAKREELLSAIRTYVEHFDQKIAAQGETGFYDAWERSREECSVVNEQGIRMLDHVKLVVHLDKLINELVPQRVSAIREQGRIFGLALSEYYKILKDIESHIGGQSTRISKEVDEELFLDGVSDSAVKIRSKISELEFWPDLQQFNELYTRWMEDGAHELPDDEYAFSMRRVMEILGRAALSGGISKLLDIELHIKEGDSDLVIRTDRQLNESSSHGMAYLILCKFLLAFTRLLRGDSTTVIHWPIDELGTLHQSNIKKIFDACQNNNIHVVGAFPNPESDVLSLFENRYLIDKAKRQLQVVEPKVSVLSQRINARKAVAGE